MKRPGIVLGLILIVNRGDSRGFALDMKQAWAVKFDGAAGLQDIPVRVEVDGQGNLYVTGYSLNAHEINDFVTVKYDPGGSQVWEVRYAGPLGEGVGREMAGSYVDGAGDVWVAGSVRDAIDLTRSDFVTMRIGADGQFLWVVVLDDGSVEPDWRSPDIAAALTVDAKKNSYVSGSSSTRVAGYWLTVKYDPGGRELWRARFEYNPGGRPMVEAIAVDQDENVYLAGNTLPKESGLEQFTIVKYDPDGIEAWVAYRSQRPIDSHLTDLALDSFGNVFVTGYGDRAPDGCFKYITVKYDVNGCEIWTARYASFVPQPPQSCPAIGGLAKAVGVSSDGRVYVAGDSWHPSEAKVGFGTVAYEAETGDQIWVAHHYGIDISVYEATDLVLDSQQNVYVLGVEYNFPREPTIAVLKYDRAGNELSVAHLGGLPGWESQDPNPLPASMAVDGDGNVIVSTIVMGANDRYDWLTVKLTPVVSETAFVRADANADGKHDLSDAVFALTYLFSGGSPPPCTDSADSNGDGRIEISDPVHSLGYLFQGTEPPVAPFPTCGKDPKQNPLGCAEYPPCRS